MYQPDASGAQQLMTIGQSFQRLINRLEQDQVEYDLGSEDIIARHGSVATSSTTKTAADVPALFVVGQCRYHTVVLPAHTENLNAPTVKLLEQFLASGGRVLCTGTVPLFVDGSASDRLQTASQQAGWQAVDEAQLPQTLLALSRDGFAIQRQAGDQGLLFHHRRQLDDGQLLLLVNTSIEHPSAGTIRAPARGVTHWSASSGESTTYPFEPNDAGVTCSIRFTALRQSAALAVQRTSRAGTGPDRVADASCTAG